MGGGPGGEVSNDYENIKALGKRFEDTVTPKLNQAISDAGALHLAESAFTAVTYALAIAYTEASAYMIKDMQSKVKRADDIAKGLYQHARIWQESGQKSKIQEV